MLATRIRAVSTTVYAVTADVASPGVAWVTFVMVIAAFWVALRAVVASRLVSPA